MLSTPIRRAPSGIPIGNKAVSYTPLFNPLVPVPPGFTPVGAWVEVPMVIDLISQELSLATFSGALLGTGFSGIEMRMVFTSVEVPATPPVVIPLAILFTSPGADYVTATGQAIGPMGMPNGRVHVELEVKGTAGDVALGALICLVQ